MIRVLHPVAGTIGLLCTAAFWTSMVAVEVLGGPASILAAKAAILRDLLVLLPAMAAAGATGFRMAGRSAEPHVARKRRRMPLIALNGLFVLLAGAVNLALMGLNTRDGFALTRRFAKA